MERDRVVRVAVDGLSDRLLWSSARALERLGAPFTVEGSARMVDADGAPVSVDFDGLIGRTAEVALALSDGEEHRTHGVVDDIELRYGELILTIVPRIAKLADAIDHQVFLQKDAVSIACEVLKEHGIDVAIRATRALP